MKFKSLVIYVFICISYMPVAYSEESVSAHNLVDKNCASCHGNGGVGKTDDFPNLKGQKQKYLIKQLMDFKNGTRKDPVMEAIAKLLSDEDIRLVSKYYSNK